MLSLHNEWLLLVPEMHQPQVHKEEKQSQLSQNSNIAKYAGDTYAYFLIGSPVAPLHSLSAPPVAALQHLSCCVNSCAVLIRAYLGDANWLRCGAILLVLSSMMIFQVDQQCHALGQLEEQHLINSAIKDCSGTV